MDTTNSVWADRPLWEKWEASDPNGHPLETETWKLWDPTQEEADNIVNLVRAGRVGSLRRTEAEEAFSTHGIPRYVRLSDSAVGVIVRLWLSRRARKKWYSLDFTAAWTLLQHRTCLGHAWLTDRKPTRYLRATLWGNLNQEEVVRFRDSVSVDQWGNVDPQVDIGEVLPTKEKLPFLFNDRDYLRWRAEEEFLSRLAEQSHTLPIKQDRELLSRQESGEALPTEINDPFVTLDEDLRQLAEKPPALTTNQDSELPELGEALPTEINDPFVTLNEDLRQLAEKPPALTTNQDSELPELDEALPNETKDRLPATEDEEYFRHLAQTLQALPTEPDSKPLSREKLGEALPPE